MRGRIPYVMIVGYHIDPCGSRDFPNQAFLFLTLRLFLSLLPSVYVEIAGLAEIARLHVYILQQEKEGRPGNEAMLSFIRAVNSCQTDFILLCIVQYLPHSLLYITQEIKND